MNAFVERYHQIMDKAQIRSELRLWRNAIVFGLIVLTCVNVYLYISEKDYDFHYFNKSLAGTAVWLIGFSLALSGLCYFWDFVDTKIVYRKFLGIVGYGFGILHAYVSLIFYLNKSVYAGSNFELFYVWNFFSFRVSNLIAFSSAIIAILIFAVMTIISNRYATMELGGMRWRAILRTGYAAIIFVLIHFSLKNYDNWVYWLKNMNSLPSHNMILGLFIFFVLILRLALLMAIMSKSSKIS